MKVLICDDDLVSLRRLEVLLKNMGLEVTSTGSASEALSLLSSPYAPKIALLDWMMPEYSGIEICKQIRQQSTAISTYLILVTSRKEPVDLAEGLNAGANDYVTKPYHEVELTARIRAGLRIVSLEGELKTLTGLLPICSWCKKIRMEDGQQWVQIEEYVGKHSYAQFSHGGCPECIARVRTGIATEPPQ